MDRRTWMHQMGWVGAGAAAAASGCGGGISKTVPVAPLVNRFVQTHLVANRASYGARMTEPGFVNAWGIAIRPAGAGGHF